MLLSKRLIRFKTFEGYLYQTVLRINDIDRKCLILKGDGHQILVSSSLRGFPNTWYIFDHKPYTGLAKALEAQGICSKPTMHLFGPMGEKSVLVRMTYGPFGMMKEKNRERSRW